MSKKQIGESLRKYRELSGLSVNDVAEVLNQKGITISSKAIYSWETGYRQPDADILLLLCKIYKINDVFEAFGYGSLNNVNQDLSDNSGLITDNLDRHLLSLFHQLNDAGKESVLTAAEGAVMNAKYVSNSSKESTASSTIEGIVSENHA